MTKPKDYTGLNIIDSIYKSSKIIKYGGYLAALILIGVAIYIGVNWLRNTGDSRSVVDEEEKIRWGYVGAPWFQNGTVPIAVGDSLVKIERVEALDAQEIELTISHPEIGSIGIEENDPWFPELSSPSDKYTLHRLRNDSLEYVGVVSNPRPFMSWEFSPLLGGGAYSTGDTLNPSFYGGLDVFRVGPLHGQIGITSSTGENQGPVGGFASGLVGRDVQLAPGAGVLLKEDLMLNGSYMVDDNTVYLGLSYKF